MPDDHSKLVPLLPIPNRTVKRLSADDSAGSRVKVGHCQALTASESPSRKRRAFCFLGMYSYSSVTEAGHVILLHHPVAKLINFCSSKGLKSNCRCVEQRRF